MTALTGETGAGKTMVVGALVRAGRRPRPTASWCAAGADEAVVEGRFDAGRRRGRPQPGRAPRPDGRGRTSTAGWRRVGAWPTTATRAPRAARPARPRRAADGVARNATRSTASAGIDLESAARGAVRRVKAADATLAGLGGDAATPRGRSASCATSSTSSTAPASTTSTRTTVWPPRRTSSATPRATSTPLAAALRRRQHRRRRRRRARRRPRRLGRTVAPGRRGGEARRASPSTSTTSPPTCVR